MNKNILEDMVQTFDLVNVHGVLLLHISESSIIVHLLRLELLDLIILVPQL